MFEYLTTTYPWLKRIADRADLNVWRFFVDTTTWGHIPPQFLNAEILGERDQLGSNIFSPVSLEDQVDEDVWNKCCP
jgi:hypothetical protein